MNQKAVNLLIIDDEQETLDLLKIALERNGYRAYIASCWEEVIQQIERMERDKQEVDIIILDVMMPGRSGFDILRALQVVLVPMPPVIILSAVIGFEQRVYARDMGVEKYLTKPTTPKKLVNSIKEVLSKKS